MELVHLLAMELVHLLAMELETPFRDASSNIFGFGLYIRIHLQKSRERSENNMLTLSPSAKIPRNSIRRTLLCIPPPCRRNLSVNPLPSRRNSSPPKCQNLCLLLEME